jgi:hypothetical protein
MRLLKVAAFAVIGYLGYRYYGDAKKGGEAAFADDQSPGENFAKVRDAGPQAMADKPREWSAEDEASDESFPASDPPATY